MLQARAEGLCLVPQRSEQGQCAGESRFQIMCISGNAIYRLWLIGKRRLRAARCFHSLLNGMMSSLPRRGVEQ